MAYMAAAKLTDSASSAPSAAAAASGASARTLWDRSGASLSIFCRLAAGGCCTLEPGPRPKVLPSCHCATQHGFTHLSALL